ncbi:hypothetical protein A3K62_01515 [Candidatus Pacearchaeota archaeon RBG_16_35_8]|nr:MAG: hypothetical protein A3K62_01515 [Candidatus Pacearchaeota archaeon RBG_16_35_8]
MVKAEFFDIFGFIGFVVLLITGLSIKNEIGIRAWIIIIISLIGLIIDGYVVLTKFILKK